MRLGSHCGGGARVCMHWDSRGVCGGGRSELGWVGIGGSLTVVQLWTQQDQVQLAPVSPVGAFHLLHLL